MRLLETHATRALHCLIVAHADSRIVQKVVSTILPIERIFEVVIMLVLASWCVQAWVSVCMANY